MKRMRSDARYTALLVARGDDDEFRREALAPSKGNSTAYSSRRKRPASSTRGETVNKTVSPQLLQAGFFLPLLYTVELSLLGARSSR